MALLITGPSMIQPGSFSNPHRASGQCAAQMMCLVFNLPLIAGDKFAENNVWELLLLFA